MIIFVCTSGVLQVDTNTITQTTIFDLYIDEMFICTFRFVCIICSITYKVRLFVMMSLKEDYTSRRSSK